MNRKVIGLPLWVWLVVIGMIVYNCYLTSSNTCSRPKNHITSIPTTGAPTFAATHAPTTGAPTTGAPTTGAPTFAATHAPTTGAPTFAATHAPTTGAPTFAATHAPTTGAPVKEAFDGDKPKLMFFQMKNCPHCVRFAPQWEELRTRQNVTNKVNLITYDSKDDKEIVIAYGITGFPTILYQSSTGKIIPYDGPRKCDAIETFIKNL